MKRPILVLVAAVTLLAIPVFGQTISVLGTSGSTTAGGTFDVQMSLQIVGTNSIGNVESVNMLLRTPSTGADSGAGLFTVQFLSATSPFTLANNTSVASFNTAGDANNSGFTVSTTSIDLGANAPAASAAPVSSSGTTTIPFDTLRFTADPNIAPGVYTFSVTLGGFADSQGSYIANSSNADFDINSAPTFTITIVPEPATWSLMALGGLSAFGLNFLRRRRA